MRTVKSRWLAMLLVCAMFAGFSGHPANASRAQPIGGDLADYSGQLREATPRADGIYHLDTPAMIRKLQELHVNTYYYLVWYERTDWDDLKNEFLPAAQHAGIRVVVYLVPPTESQGPRKSYPYLTDYVAWGKAIAELSLQYPNLIGWAIDDFNHNLNFYTPEYMAQMKAAAQAVNPKLTFMPLMYSTSLTEDFLATRGQYIDGVIVAYRDDPYRNTQVWSSEQEQIDAAYSLLQKYHLPLVFMLYTSQLTLTPANPTVEYVRETVQIALDNMRQGKLAGVITYELEKNFVPETADQKAYDGSGYLSLFIPGGVRTKPGDFVSATQTIRPDGSGNYKLSFRTMDEGQYLAGYHFKQLLVDGTVVWEEDVAANTTDRQWQEVDVDLTPYLSGKSQADLTFRLYEKQGVSNYWHNNGFDALKATGFTVANGSFEEKGGWTFAHTNPGLIGEILLYDPDRREKAFDAVKASYALYDLYAGITNSDVDPGIKNSLTVKISQAMDRYFAEQTAEALRRLNALANEIRAQAGKHIPQETADLWLAEIEQWNPLD